MTKIVGITGGIGSGKTTLIEFVKSQGFLVYVADEEAKKLLNSEEISNKVQFLFSEYVLIKDKILDKKKLADVIFSNPAHLQKMNALIHPLVQQDFENWVNNHKGEKILFKESAILFESGAAKHCDYVILITAPIDVRIDRVVKRDNTTREKVIERMNNQWSDEQKASFSDYIIENIDLTLAKQEIIKVINMIY